MEIIATSVIAFATTNLDDLFILALFFGTQQFATREIVAGQYLGISALTAASWVGSLAGLVIPSAYIGLLGAMPIYIGVKGIVRLAHHSTQNLNSTDPVGELKYNYPVLTVAFVTLANGGDNISIYLPLFATLTLAHQLIMTTVFLIMTAAWCGIASYLTQHPLVRNALDRYGHRITPFIMILLGLFILYESRTFQGLPFTF